jgi:SAM-dependent methyltransferase
MSNDQQAAAWSEFWRTGALHSCVGSFGSDGYGGAIGAFWRDVLAGMEAHDRVLDVGTGNGPLPRLIAMHFANTVGGMPSVDAIDIAAVAPGWHDPDAYPRVRFHPRTSASAMPFAAGSFGWIVSQYGFEYADFPAAADECARVLAPGGKVAMVLHHVDSVICRVGREELAHHRRLLAAGGLIEAARTVMPHLAAAASAATPARPDAAAEAARTAYNAAMTSLGQAIETAAVPDLLISARQSVHALV